MSLENVKFFCSRCGADITDSIRRFIERRCKELSIDPSDLGEKARDAARIQMLREMGEDQGNPAETGFIVATALILMEMIFSPSLLCNSCRSPAYGIEAGEKVKLQLLKGGKREE